MAEYFGNVYQMEKHKKEIEKIIGGMKCPRDFKCYKSGFKNLCKAKDIGVEGYVECLEDNPAACVFSVPFGHTFFLSHTRVPQTGQ